MYSISSISSSMKWAINGISMDILYPHQNRIFLEINCPIAVFYWSKDPDPSRNQSSVPSDSWFRSPNSSMSCASEMMWKYQPVSIYVYIVYIYICAIHIYAIYIYNKVYIYMYMYVWNSNEIHMELNEITMSHIEWYLVKQHIIQLVGIYACSSPKLGRYNRPIPIF